MTKTQKDNAASRIARAITDAYNRTNEMPTEEEIKEAVVYALDLEAGLNLESLKVKSPPLKQLRSIVGRVAADTEACVDFFKTTDEEHGRISRLRKWQRRLTEVCKVQRWLAGFPPSD